tara:strand:- start:1046 stop:1276 length:231 start_codon:yes stop_codon:yes gene_type:complete
MVNSKYLFPISEKMLMVVKTNNKRKMFCSYHKSEPLRKKFNQRICLICNLESRKKSSQKYLQKKELAKSAKFTTRF